MYRKHTGNPDGKFNLVSKFALPVLPTLFNRECLTLFNTHFYRLPDTWPYSITSYTAIVKSGVTVKTKKY